MRGRARRLESAWLRSSSEVPTATTSCCCGVRTGLAITRTAPDSARSVSRSKVLVPETARRISAALSNGALRSPSVAPTTLPLARICANPVPSLPWLLSRRAARAPPSPGPQEGGAAGRHDLGAAHKAPAQANPLPQPLLPPPPPPHPTTGWIDPQRADLENGGPLDLSTPRQRA